MNILIVCDLEGAHGICDFENWVETNAIHLNQARKLFTEELNQVIAGFRAGGATRITDLLDQWPPLIKKSGFNINPQRS
jgi:D-aminopeptidase